VALDERQHHPEGIQLDLIGCARGPGWLTVFEGAIDTPTVVKQRLIYMTPPWKEAFQPGGIDREKPRPGGLDRQFPDGAKPVDPGFLRASHEEAGLERDRVEGGAAFTGTLPQPPKTTGTFQNYTEQNHGKAMRAAARPLILCRSSMRIAR